MWPPGLRGQAPATGRARWRYARAVSSDPLAEARRERDLILDRVTWWDTHRYSAIFPIAIGFFAAGYGLGVALKQFAGAPERTEVVLALGFLFLAGRFIERRYATANLDRIDALIARLERERRSAPPSPTRP